MFIIIIILARIDFFKVFKHRAWCDAVLGSSPRIGEGREGLEAVF